MLNKICILFILIKVSSFSQNILVDKILPSYSKENNIQISDVKQYDDKYFISFSDSYNYSLNGGNFIKHHTWLEILKSNGNFVRNFGLDSSKSFKISGIFKNSENLILFGENILLENIANKYSFPFLLSLDNNYFVKNSNFDSIPEILNHQTFLPLPNINNLMSFDWVFKDTGISRKKYEFIFKKNNFNTLSLDSVYKFPINFIQNISLVSPAFISIKGKNSILINFLGKYNFNFLLINLDENCLFKDYKLLSENLTNLREIQQNGQDLLAFNSGFKNQNQFLKLDYEFNVKDSFLIKTSHGEEYYNKILASDNSIFIIGSYPTIELDAAGNYAYKLIMKKFDKNFKELWTYEFGKDSVSQGINGAFFDANGNIDLLGARGNEIIFYKIEDKLTSVEEDKSQGYSYYLNDKNLSLNLPEANSLECKIFDYLGNLMKSYSNSNSQNFQYDLNDLNSGIYFVELKNNMLRKTFKIAIQ